MLEQADQEKISAMIKTYWFIYFSFVVGVAMYVMVTFMVTSSGTPQDSRPDTLGRALIVVSILAAFVKVWAHRKQVEEKSYAGCQNLDDIIKKYASYFFISLGMAEIPALCGMVMVFLTQRMGEWAIFIIISTVLFAMSAPRSGVLENVVAAWRMWQTTEAE